MRQKIEKMLITSSMGDNIGFIPLNEEDSEELNVKDLPVPLPILALRNSVLFPTVVLPITVSREKSIKLIRDSYAGKRLIGALCQLNSAIEDPEGTDLHEIGTIARILKIFEMPDGAITVLVQGTQRFAIQSIESKEPYLTAHVKLLEDEKASPSDKDFDGIIGSIRDLVSRFIKLSPQAPQEAAFAVKNIENKNFLINFISAHIDFSEGNDRQILLEKNLMKERGLKLVEILNHELQLLEIKNDIQGKVRTEMDQQQREYFLHQQIKTIQNELGDNPTEGEATRLEEKAKDLKWPDNVKTTFEKELAKFRRMNPNGGEYSVQLSYLDQLTDLPWKVYSEDNLDLKHAQEILDEDHFGMDEVKERILEFLAVLKLKGGLKSPIICLHGPPGVGKTSLGKSIARALGRQYSRVSLGGLHDEAEIRGHRRTYIGAMPGRIIQNITRCKTSNPLIILDEIDKVGKDQRGDPSSALLEVLDPEQNGTFRDNYLDVEYDLSQVLFITTANRIDTIQPALRDRMEMIHISGYNTEEKIQIAKRHLVPKVLESHGVESKKLELDDKILEEIIESYTRESGVRALEKQLAKLIRNRAKSIALGEKTKKKIDLNSLHKILGASRMTKELVENSDAVGVTTGLAWTEMGGAILFVEASLSPGKGGLTITGNLGDVMKESVSIALQYVKAHAKELTIEPEMFENQSLHIHVPEGAIPKDGPSAGVTMVTSMASVYTKRKVRKAIAMTGEITLRGKVLPVGGIKEKILAAKRAGAKEILMSKENKKDIAEIKPEYLEGLSFTYVDTIDEVWKFALC